MALLITERSFSNRQDHKLMEGGKNTLVEEGESSWSITVADSGTWTSRRVPGFLTIKTERSCARRAGKRKKYGEGVGKLGFGGKIGAFEKRPFLSGGL